MRGLQVDGSQESVPGSDGLEYVRIWDVHRAGRQSIWDVWADVQYTGDFLGWIPLQVAYRAQY